MFPKKCEPDWPDDHACHTANPIDLKLHTDPAQCWSTKKPIGL